MGFGVEGSIEGDKIILRGIAPGLGLNSCKVETTYYDTPSAHSRRGPGRDPAGGLTNRGGRISRDESRGGIAGSIHVARLSRLPLPLRVRNGEIVLKPSSEPYYHEALDYRPAAPSISSPQTLGIFTACRRFELTGLRLVVPRRHRKRASAHACAPGAAHKNGALEATPSFCRSTPVRRTSGADNHVSSAGKARVFCRSPRTSYPPTILPACTDRIPVAARRSRESFFLMLANWFPLPQLHRLAALSCGDRARLLRFLWHRPVLFPLSQARLVLALVGGRRSASLFYALTVSRRIFTMPTASKPWRSQARS